MRRLVLVTVLALLAAGGVWVATASDEPGEPPARTASRPAEPTPAATPPPRRARRTPIARCPAGLAGCRSVRGRVIYVESVDPDGDGDLHVVLAAGGVTAPGVTAVDVEPALRPPRDPSVGDQLSAAGQVQRGSFGQAQIHASVLHVRR